LRSQGDSLVGMANLPQGESPTLSGGS
jgi:hypothetical protein